MGGGSVFFFALQCKWSWSVMLIYYKSTRWNYVIPQWHPKIHLNGYAYMHGGGGDTMRETATPTSPPPLFFWMLCAVWQVLKIKVQEIIDLCTSNLKKISREGCSAKVTLETKANGNLRLLFVPCPEKLLSCKISIIWGSHFILRLEWLGSLAL